MSILNLIWAHFDEWMEERSVVEVAQYIQYPVQQ